MSERYPDDAMLLATQADAVTGVEYIPTGRSPYYLEFRKLVQRMLLAGQRANDLRVYQEGDLTVGVRSGRSRVGIARIDFAGQTGISVGALSTTHIWLSEQGQVVTGTTGLPADRRQIIPLAMVTSGAMAITSITDLRGETMLGLANLASLGVMASSDEINQVLSGIAASVTPQALARLTGGSAMDADADHRHQVFAHHQASETGLMLINESDDPQAGIALVMGLPNLLVDNLVVSPDPASGWLTQRYDGQRFHMLGVTTVQYAHQGSFTATLADRLMGVVQVAGTVSGVMLSCADNLQSTVGSDGVSATVKVNGVTLTTTAAQLTSAAGAGFRSTAQGHGTAAVVKSDGTQNVEPGDVLTVDLVRNVSGSVSTEMAQVVVWVVIKVSQPG